MAEPDTLLEFRGVYGRMCVLVASALKKGYAEKLVLEASRGQGKTVGLVYTNLRMQRGRVNDALALCEQAGVSNIDKIHAARQAREAVQQEFELRIPIMG